MFQQAADKKHSGQKKANSADGTSQMEVSEGGILPGLMIQG
jgi:hypothetical protein